MLLKGGGGRAGQGDTEEGPETWEKTQAGLMTRESSGGGSGKGRANPPPLLYAVASSLFSADRISPRFHLQAGDGSPEPHAAALRFDVSSTEETGRSEKRSSWFQG